MEAERDLTQLIVHVDMDAFYANVELLDDPSLAGKPFAVSIISPSASTVSLVESGWPRRGLHCLLRSAEAWRTLWDGRYELYQSFGFPYRASFVGFIAKKLCPDLVVVPSHFPRYIEMSKQIMAIFRQYDPNMCAAGCDEGYLKYVLLYHASPFISHAQFQYHAVLRRALDNCGRVCARDARTRTQRNSPYCQRWHSPK